MFRRLQLFLQRASKWFGRRGVAFTYAYAREHRMAEREHFHLAVHVPHRQGAAFERAARSWAARDAMDPHSAAPETIEITKPPTDELLRYLLKGGDELVRHTYRVRRRHPTQGVIHGRRVGVSRILTGRRVWLGPNECECAVIR